MIGQLQAKRGRNFTLQTAFIVQLLMMGDSWMTAYVFRLHDGPDTPPREENVEARSDAEAHDLADLRIRLSGTFTAVDVSRAGQHVFSISKR